MASANDANAPTPPTPRVHRTHPSPSPPLTPRVQDVPSPQCRQTCRALSVSAYRTSWDSYQAHATSDADMGVGGTGIMATTMTIPGRAATLYTWNDAWTTLDEILCGPRELNTVCPFLSMPSRDKLRSGRTAQVISGPSPGSAPIASLGSSPAAWTGTVVVGQD